MQALFLDQVRDHTEQCWFISRDTSGRDFRVSTGAHVFTVAEIAVPIPVENYELTAVPDMVGTIFRGIGPLT